MEQETPDVRRLAIKDLLLDIVQQIAVAAGEPLNKGRAIRTLPHGQASQLQAGDPSLGALLNRRTSCSASPSPSARLKKLLASAVVKRKSAAQISSSSPRARQRASGNGGSTRLARMRCSLSGGCSRKRVIPS